MTHVFMLNMCFDVPVKLYSFAYLVMAIFLIAPDLPRLDPSAGPGQGRGSQPVHAVAGQRQARSSCAVVLRTLLVIAMVYGQIRGSYKMLERHVWRAAASRGRPLGTRLDAG